MRSTPYALRSYLQTYDNTVSKYVPLELFPDQIQLIQDYENYNENEYFLLFHNIHPILIYSNNEYDKKKKEFQIKLLNDLEPDILIVLGWGQILSKDVLNIPKIGVIGAHASLLPFYRGSAPINWAIINGERVTGVTTFFIEQEIDTGLVIERQSVAIG